MYLAELALVAACGVFFFLVVACVIWSSPGGAVVNNLPANAGMQVWSLGQEDPLEKGNPMDRREELVGYSPWGSQRVRYHWATEHTHVRSIPWLGMELGPPSLGGWSLSFWTIREVTINNSWYHYLLGYGLWFPCFSMEEIICLPVYTCRGIVLVCTESKHVPYEVHIKHRQGEW